MKFQKLTRPQYSFTGEELIAANQKWGCNCGPAALAAILGTQLEIALTALPGFENKRYTNPTMMKEALATLGVKWHDRSANDPSNFVDEMADQEVGGVSLFSLKDTDYRNFTPHTLVRYGLVRIQFEPWYGRLAYHFTHWVAAASFEYLREQCKCGCPPVKFALPSYALWVFDVNYGWRRFDEWAALMPELAKDASPKSDGNWHATHRWELEL